MKPLSPVLYLTAVQAAAMRASSVEDGADVSVRFVMEMGEIAHLDGCWTSTSWPLVDVETVDDLVTVAWAMGMTRGRPMGADIIVMNDKGVRRAGVILGVLQHVIGMSRQAECRIAVAARRHGVMEVLVLDRLCAAERGDVFIRWHQPMAEGLGRRSA